MNKWLSVAASAVLMVSIVGCNSSDGSSSSTETGTFVDAPVQGLYYKTATQSGFTDSKGSFKYKKGETVEFKLGTLFLGKGIAKKAVTPYDIADDNVTKAINIALVLQNFDANKSNTKILDLSKLKDFNFSSNVPNLDITPSELKSKVSDLFNNDEFSKYIDNTAVIDPIKAKKKMDDYLRKHPDTMVGTVVPLDNMNFPLATAQFSNGFDLNATWGIGSGATHKDGDPENIFYTITDRGVNIKCKDAEDITGMNVCGDGNKGKIFPFPDFTPTIFKFKLVGNKAEVLNVIPLVDKDGKGITGISNPISNFTEEAYDINGNPLTKNIDGVDSEAITALDDGTFWISEEYSPSLLHIAADGKVIERLVPKSLESEYSDATYDVKGALPDILAKRHENRGIESIAVSPDQKYLYFMMQSPLDNPDYSKSRSVRLYKMEIADPSDIKEYLFVIDTPDVFATDNLSKKRKQKDVKVSGMEVLGNDKLMIDERIHTSRLYTVDLTSAKPVTEQQSANLETNTTGVTPLAKTLVFSTDPKDGYVTATDGYPEKIEGIAHLGGTKFLLINDDDFGIEGDKTVAKIANINLSNIVSSIEFAPLALSTNDTEKQNMRVSNKLTATYADGHTQEYPLSYKTLMEMGDKIGNGIIGQITDKDGKPILKADGSYDISDGPDGNSIINVGDKTYLVTHMEERPGELYETEIKEENGELKAIDTKPVDLSAIGGTIINCASSKTNYGSHLGGEEDYSLNSRYADSNSPFYVDCALDGSSNDVNGKFNYFCNYVDQMNKYLKDPDIDKTNGYNGSIFTPYNYGYIVEVQPQADGSTKSAKHYVTGRYTPELAKMMPDDKTVYMTDDGTAKGFYKFVSDKKIADFTPDWEGTLYAAKVTQTSSANGGKFDLSWVKLGHAKDSEIKTMVDSKMKLTDIFYIQKPDANGTCTTAGFTPVYEDSEVECLKLKSGKEKEAAFLETRKYAAYKGATIEFRKEEGLTYNPKKNVLYVAMSAVEKSMEDNYKGEEPANDIRLPKNSCGAVYEITLDSTYNGTSMQAIVNGKPLQPGEQYADEYACDPDGIANPDNIKYLGHDILFIGEDTTKHVNNMGWAYNTEKGTMIRIASLPIGAEVTGVDKGVVGDKGVLMVDAQHPFKDNPKAADGTKPNSSLIENATDEQLKAFVGYIDGIPAEVFK